MSLSLSVSLCLSLSLSLSLSHIYISAISINRCNSVLILTRFLFLDNEISLATNCWLKDRNVYGIMKKKGTVSRVRRKLKRNEVIAMSKSNTALRIVYIDDQREKMADGSEVNIERYESFVFSYVATIKTLK